MRLTTPHTIAEGEEENTMKKNMLRGLMLGGTAALGLALAAVSGETRGASACEYPDCLAPQPGPVVVGPVATMPSGVSTQPLPNLRPMLLNSFCNTYSEGGTKMQINVRIQNTTNFAAGSSVAAVKVDNKIVDFHLVPGPLFGAHLYTVNLPATAGAHSVTVIADYTGTVSEQFEGDNTVNGTVVCPA